MNKVLLIPTLLLALSSCKENSGDVPEGYGDPCESVDDECLSPWECLEVVSLPLDDVEYVCSQSCESDDDCPLLPSGCESPGEHFQCGAGVCDAPPEGPGCD